MKRTLLATLLLAFFAATANADTTLYDLSTAEISGVNQNTYMASSVNAGGRGGTFTGTLPTNLLVTNGGAFNTQGDYFVGKFSTASLTNVGDTLTLSFTVTTTNFSVSTQTLRFGLFSLGTATTGSQTPASDSYSSATGYRVDYGASGGANGIRERTSANANLFASGNSPLVGTQTSSNFTFQPLDATAYSGSLILQLLAGNQVQITSQIGSLSSTNVIDTAAAFTSFDSFGFYEVSNGTASTLNFTALTVATNVVPEPGSIALLMIGFVTVFAARRKRTA